MTDNYGILIEVQFTDDNKARVAITPTQERTPFAALAVAAEHLLNAVAMESNAGYEKALDLVRDGAIRARGQIRFDG